MSQAAFGLSLGGIAFLLTVIWGEPLIRVLRQFEIGDQIRIELRERHMTKMGTPTMGGILFVVPVVLITLVLNVVNLVGRTVIGRSILLPLGVLIGFAILGAVDDWQGIRGKRAQEGLGITPRQKFAAQWVIALGAALALRYLLGAPALILPALPFEIDLGVLYIPAAMFVIVASSNAVNFTDGMDGLAGLVSATIFAAYGVIALLQGQVFIVRFCFTIVGALFAFLWFNVHPAEMIMGGIGSESLGATLGVVALMTGHWALLPLIAIIPVSEAISVILQVSYFKATGGRRVFKMSPLHYHFELLGWSETQVVQRFWLISLLAAMVGIGLALI